MELNDAVRRIVGVHWRIVLACLLAGLLGGVAALYFRGGDHYTASARLVLDAQDPRSASESTALADTAAAIVSSHSVVAAALGKAGTADRDPAAVSESVSVRALGISGVLELSVRDRSPMVAASIANGLVRELIVTRLEANTAKYRETLATLDTRIRASEQTLATLERRIAELDVRAETAGAAEAAEIRTRRSDLARARGLAAEQRSSLESTRDTILTTNALRPTPTIVSKAVPPAQADPVNLVANLLLAAFAGVILGIGIAGLIESVRPTIVGGDAIARDLETVHFGLLAKPPDSEQPQEQLASVVVQLKLVVEALRRPYIDLLTAGGLPEPRYLAQQLQAVAARAVDSTGAPSELRIRYLGIDTPPSRDPGATALVLVLPEKLKKRELVRLRRLAESASLPILGVITCEPGQSVGVGRLQGRDRAMRSSRGNPVEGPAPAPQLRDR